MTLSYQLDNLLRDELKPGERLLWHGQPRPLGVLRHEVGKFILGVVGIAVGVAWTVFMTHGTPETPACSVFTTNEQFIWRYFGHPFVLAGLVCLLASAWAFCRAKNTVYSITSARAFILSPKFFGGYKTQSFTPLKLRFMEARHFSDGSGDLIFMKLRKSANTPDGFLAIHDVRAAERILTTMRDEHLKTPGYSEPANFIEKLLKFFIPLHSSDDSKQPPTSP